MAGAGDRARDAACECVGYTIRTDYGTGTEHDVDRSSCPIHSGVSAPEVEALVEVAAEVIYEHDREDADRFAETWPDWNDAADDWRETFRAAARAVLAAVAEPLMALGRAEVEREIPLAVAREHHRMIASPLCCCGQTTSRLLVCPVHPEGPCTCDPRHLEAGGFDPGCVVHDPAAARV